MEISRESGEIVRRKIGLLGRTTERTVRTEDAKDFSRRKMRDRDEVARLLMGETGFLRL